MQFIRAHRDGRLYFIENNPRLSAGIAHSIACGFDGPLLTLAATASDETQMQPIAEMENSYRVGLRGHWLEGDIEGWLRERGAMTLKQSARRVSLILRSFMRARSHMTWDWRDPLPGIRLGLGMLARLARATREF